MLSLLLVERLAGIGWAVQRRPRRRPLPPAVLARYPAIPVEYRRLVESFDNVSAADERAWFVTSEVFRGSGSAFAWNEWELQSLAAAVEDRSSSESIVRFWDRHLPVIMSVKSGYVHLALDLETTRVVVGQEPEYEDVSPLASSIEELLGRMLAGDPALTPWV